MRTAIFSTLLAIACFEAHAAPKLTITGEAVLRLTSVRRLASGRMVIVGDLRDAYLLSGITGQRVTVELSVGNGIVQQSVRTDDEGRFRVEWPMPRGSYVVSARFGGSREFAQAQVAPRAIDVSKSYLNLSIATPRQVDASSERHEVEIVAEVDGLPVDVPVTLATPTGRLGHGRTGARGRLRVEFPAARLRHPGPMSLIARFEGNAELNPARARRDVLVMTPVKISLLADDARVEADGWVSVRGRVSDLSGPVTAGTVSLEVLGRHRTSTSTDAAGRFRFALPASSFPPGPLDARVIFTPTVAWRRRATAATQVRVLAPRPIPMLRYALPAAATLLLCLVLVTIRLRPRWPQRDRRRIARESEEAAGGHAPLTSGVQQARSGLRGILTHDHTISGIVWDPADNRPIRGARIRLAGPAEPIDTTAGPDGCFTVADLAPGTYAAQFSAPGYVGERMAFEIPHRGNLRDLRVLLVAVRVRVLEIYRELALPRLPTAERWGRWTPRDLLGHLDRAGARHPALEGLSSLLERVYWGPGIASEDAVRQAREVAGGQDAAAP